MVQKFVKFVYLDCECPSPPKDKDKGGGRGVHKAEMQESNVVSVFSINFYNLEFIIWALQNPGFALCVWKVSQKSLICFIISPIFTKHALLPCHYQAYTLWLR